jgi:hypothetical protein
VLCCVVLCCSRGVVRFHAVKPGVCVCACVGPQVGYRLGKYLRDIIQQFLLSIDREAEDADELAANDLRENCFQVQWRCTRVVCVQPGP